MARGMLDQAGIRSGGPVVATDDEIVRRVVGGEAALFEVLMRRHNPKVYRAVRSVLRNEDEVEDAMQQAYLQAYVHLRDFGGASSFSTWLVRIALNEAIGRVRSRRLVPVAEIPEREDDGTAGRGPEDEAAMREAMTLLEKAVDRLPEMYRTVYLLREIEQMSAAEVAEVLGISEDAVKVRLHRARRTLRDLLAQEIGAAAPHAFPFLAPRCDRIVDRVLSAIGARRA
jgi:RNA polymerase sigma-70 factor (ECF subfamily)